MSAVRSLVALDFGFSDGTDVSRVGHAVRRSGMLVATITDWDDLALNVRTLPFE